MIPAIVVWEAATVNAQAGCENNPILNSHAEISIGIRCEVGPLTMDRKGKEARNTVNLSD